MTALFVPVFRLATSYTVSVGRRWSVLEQLLLTELSTRRRSTAELADLCDLPERLIMESLINLLRAGWIEMRSSDSGVHFAATPTGKSRSKDEILPDQTQRAIRWTSLCVERLTGAWLRSDDLELVYGTDLPPNADILEPRISTFDTLDGSVRSLLPLRADEGLEPVEPGFKNPSRPYARVTCSLDQISGLPDDAPLAFKQAVLDVASTRTKVARQITISEAAIVGTPMKDTIQPDDVVVGGPAHRELLQRALRTAQSHVILHSCFVDPKALRELVPDFLAAAQRGVRVDLLWGLRETTEESGPVAPIVESDRVLATLLSDDRKLVQLSKHSSGSHAKILQYDEVQTGLWTTAIGSCNFLSSIFSSIEMSLVSRSQQLAVNVLAQLIAAQLPASGAWSTTARRLNRLWEKVRASTKIHPERGDHELTLLCDQDHYACVTSARDLAERQIDIGCDLYGLAATTSVLVPLGRAAELKKTVNIYYNRPSKFLNNASWPASLSSSLPVGIEVMRVPELHGKFLLWDAQALAVTSFNWLSTVSAGTRSRGSEIGLLVKGPQLRDMLRAKLDWIPPSL